jgi:quercetin dioxygenase-like cupin family protein
MKILNLEGGTPFSMGKGKNWSILNPQAGARQITLNHSLHAGGHEFPQHIHDESVDVIVVLEGEVQLRQGSFYTPLAAGEAALVPAGEVHGTVNRSGRAARLMSFQLPPDPALYRGERNKAEAETPRPRAGSQSAVQIAALAKGGPRFAEGPLVRTVFSPHNGSDRALLEAVSLEPEQPYEHTNDGNETVFVLLEGEAEFTGQEGQKQLSRFDVLFLNAHERISLRRAGGEKALLVRCSALFLR